MIRYRGCLDAVAVLFTDGLCTARLGGLHGKVNDNILIKELL